MTDLKPCPFCGSNDLSVEPYFITQLVKCCGCYCQNTIDNWNRRAELDEYKQCVENSKNPDEYKIVAWMKDLHELRYFKQQVREALNKFRHKIGLPQYESEYVNIGIEEVGYRIDELYEELELEVKP